jgi:hypothetical protein
MVVANPSGRLLGRRLSARIGNAIEYNLTTKDAEWIGKVVGEAAGKAMGEMFKDLEKHLYLADWSYSVKLFAHLEMGGKPDGKETITANDLLTTNALMTKGSAGVFLSEKAKFAEKLKEERYSNPVLAMMSFEIVDDKQPASQLNGLGYDKKLQSYIQFHASDWRDDSKAVTANAPTVLLFVQRTAKDATEKNPVTIHCAFDYMALKEGRSVMKTLSFDLYLEKLEFQKGELFCYPWKVKNVEYK